MEFDGVYTDTATRRNNHNGNGGSSFDNIEIAGEIEDDNSGNPSSGIVKDSTRSWLVCAGAFCIQLFVMGFSHAFGVFFVVFVVEFNCSSAKAAWVGSLAYAFAFLFGPLASSLISRFGSRLVAMGGCFICFSSLLSSSFVTNIDLLFLTFSLPFGLGNSLAFSTTMSLPGIYFDKYVSVTTGIIVSGSSFGTLVLSPLSQLLISHIGWRNAFRTFAGLTFIALLGGAMYPKGATCPKTPQQRIRLSLGRRMMADLYLWKNRVFVIWIIVVCLVMFGYYVPYVHLVAYAEDLGISPAMGSSLMMFFGAGTAVGRLAFGKIITLGIIDRLHMHQLSMVVTGAGTMILPLITSYEGLVAYVIIIGLVDGCFVVLLPVMTSSLMGVDNMVLAWGSVIGCSALTNMLGPPVAGWIYDATGSYNAPFHISGIPVIMGAVMLFFIPWAQRTSQGTNIMQAAIESPYEAMSEEHLQSDQEMFQIGGTPQSGSDASIQTLTAKPKTSYIVMDRNNPSSYLVVGQDDQGAFSVQHVTSIKTLPEEVVNAIEVYQNMVESMQSKKTRDRIPRRRLLSECRPEESSPVSNSRNFHSVPQSLQNLTNGGDRSGSSSANPSDVFEVNEGPHVTDTSLPIYTSSNGNIFSGTSSHTESIPNFDPLGVQTLEQQDQNVGLLLPVTSPIGSPPTLPSISEEVGQSSGHAEAPFSLGEESSGSSMIVVSPECNTSTNPFCESANNTPELAPLAVAEDSNIGSVVSETSLRLLWEELDTEDGTHRNNENPHPVDGGVFHMSDLTLDKTNSK